MGARFSAPVHTGPGAHPASYTKGTRSFPEVKRLGRGVYHPPPSSVEVEGRVELYICFPSGPSWPVLGRTLLVRYTMMQRLAINKHGFFLITTGKGFSNLARLSETSLTHVACDVPNMDSIGVQTPFWFPSNISGRYLTLR